MITKSSPVINKYCALLLALLIFVGAETVARAEDVCALPAQTAEGPVVGTGATGAAACAYLGIPYATPPTGELRFRAPQPPSVRSEALTADRFKPWCVQKYELGMLGMNSRKTETSEDCLYLNIWRPKKSGAFPVMFFIHGGGLTAGSGATGMYRGERLAAGEDVVVVTINYRLGVLGFLAHPALTAEDAHHSSGNYGLLDQIAALTWVRQNVAGFGGDPTRLTIFGESAGAWSVCSLLASPLAAGLFSRAVIQSGGGDTVKSLAAGYADGEAMAQKLGCPAPDPRACLRERSAEEILAAQTAGQADNAFAIKTMLKYTWVPKTDGYLLREPPLATLRRGNYNRVPLLIGSNRDELTIFTFNWFGIRLFPAPAARWVLNSVFGPATERDVERLYPFGAYRRPVDAVIDALGDMTLACKCYDALNAAVAFAPAYYYRFDYDRHLAPHIYGAGHALELPFIFNTFDQPDFKIFFTPALVNQAQPLSAAMMKYWANFARTGDPNGPGLAAWPVYDPNCPLRLLLDETIQVKPLDNREKCEFWAAQNFQLQ